MTSLKLLIPLTFSSFFVLFYLFYSNLIPSQLSLTSLASLSSNSPSFSNSSNLPKSFSACQNLLQTGKFIKSPTAANPSPDTWQPEGCTLKSYSNLAIISDCLRPGDQLIFYGDSTARQIFWATANLLDSSIEQDFNVHGNHRVTRNGITLKLYWDPFLNSSSAWPDLQDYAQKGIANAPPSSEQLPLNLDPAYKPKAYLYTTTGLWHAMFEPRHAVLEGYKKSLDDFVELMNNRVNTSFSKVFYGPTMLPYFPLLDKGRKAGITQDNMKQILKYTDEKFSYMRDSFGNRVQHSLGLTLKSNSNLENFSDISPNDVSIYYTPVFNDLGGSSTFGNYDQIGLHYINSAMFVQANILLNHICNERTVDPNQVPHSTTCCVSFAEPNPPVDKLVHQNDLYSVNTWNPLNTHLRTYSNNNRTHSRLYDNDGNVLVPWNQTTKTGYIYGDGTGDWLSQSGSDSDPHHEESDSIKPAPKFPDSFNDRYNLRYLFNLLVLFIFISLVCIFSSLTLQSDSLSFLTKYFPNQSARLSLISQSIFKAFLITSAISFISLYTYYCDRTPLFPKTQRVFMQWDLFEYSQLWIIGSLLSIGSLTTAGYTFIYHSPNPSPYQNSNQVSNVLNTRHNDLNSGLGISNNPSVIGSSDETSFAAQNACCSPVSIDPAHSSPICTTQNPSCNPLKTTFSPFPQQYFSVVFSAPFINEFKGICVSLLFIAKISGLDLIPNRSEGQLFIKWISGCWLVGEMLDFGLNYYDALNQSNHDPSHSISHTCFFFTKSIASTLILPACLSLTLSSTSSLYHQPPFSFFYEAAVKLLFWKFVAFLLFTLLIVPISKISKNQILASFKRFTKTCCFKRDQSFALLNGLETSFSSSATQNTITNQFRFALFLVCAAILKLILHCISKGPDSESLFATDILGFLDRPPIDKLSPAVTIHQAITTHICSSIALLVNRDYWIICITLLFTWMSHNYVVDSQDTQTTNTPKQESQAPEDYFPDMEQEIGYTHKEAREYSATFCKHNEQPFGIASIWTKPSRKLVLCTSSIFILLTSFVFFSTYFSGTQPIPVPSTVLTAATSILRVSRPHHLGKTAKLDGGSFIDYRGNFALLNNATDWEIAQAHGEANTLEKVWEFKHAGETQRFGTFWYTLSVLVGVFSWITVRQTVLNSTASYFKTRRYWYVRAWVWLGTISYEINILMPHLLLAGDGTTKLFVIWPFTTTGAVMSDLNIQTYIGQAAGDYLGSVVDYNTYIAIEETVRETCNVFVATALFLGIAYCAKRIVNI